VKKKPIKTLSQLFTVILNCQSQNQILLGEKGRECQCFILSPSFVDEDSNAKRKPLA
jgi:hypothetical protein